MKAKIKTAADDAAPKIYRSDLIWNAFRDAGEDYRRQSKSIGIAVNTFRDAIDGNCTKLDTLWKISRHFRIDWLELFNVDRRPIGDASFDIVLRAERGGAISAASGSGGMFHRIEPGKQLKFSAGRLSVAKNKTN